MKVFLTGATGFIGAHLVRRLVREGHEVCCLVRESSRTVELEKLGVKLVVGDVNDRLALQNGMQGCDWLFHLANLYSMWEPEKLRFRRVNVEGTRSVLEMAVETGVKKVVYVSTAAVFGKPLMIPFDEDSSPGKVLFSEYARTKAAGNEIAWDLYHSQGLPLVVLYPGIVLGAGDDKASGQYIQDIICRRVPSTIFHQSRSNYVYVGDVVEALLRAAEMPGTVGQKYLIGGYGLTGQAFAQMISQVSGVALPLFHFPDFIVIAAAYFLTALSSLIRSSPWWGLSVDAARTLENGFDFDGSKAVRSLGICYTPPEHALREAVASYPVRLSSFSFSRLWTAFLRVFHKKMENRSGSQSRGSGEKESGGVSTGVSQPSSE
ncbi:MAG: NAD-dependent epimerase/dehydratase family protein [Anaerolineaceae bacterium]|nr:NAD-dependent epimerase/dehydratase family protein [Anaerolineaceae bacterium]